MRVCPHSYTYKHINKPELNISPSKNQQPTNVEKKRNQARSAINRPDKCLNVKKMREKKEEKMNSPSPNKIHSNTINNILNWDSRRLNGN